MENLILYLYTKHIHSKDPNARTFAKLQPIKVYALAPEQLQFYNSMFIRNVFTYSASSMELRLSLKNLFGFYRLHKFEHLIKNAGIQYFFKEWIENQFMPITLPANKKIPAHSPFVFADYHDEENIQLEKNKSAEKSFKVVDKKNSKAKSKVKKNGEKQKDSQLDQLQSKKSKNSKIIAMINVLELTAHLQNQILSKQLDMEASDLKNTEKRKQAIQKFKAIKIEEYIHQRYNADALMAFNFISHYPFIDQKQLLNRTMLSAVELRKCLAHLITDGIVNFYAQSSRSLLYKAINAQIMRQRYIDHITHAMLNLFIYLGTEQPKDEEKISLVLKSISELDDILMIFMA